MRISNFMIINYGGEKQVFIIDVKSM
jgi:hypothetical protein